MTITRVLLPGWTKEYSRSSKSDYYFNSETNDSYFPSFRRPPPYELSPFSSPGSNSTPPPQSPPPLPPQSGVLNGVSERYLHNGSNLTVERDEHQLSPGQADTSVPSLRPLSLPFLPPNIISDMTTPSLTQPPAIFDTKREFSSFVEMCAYVDFTARVIGFQSNRSPENYTWIDL